MLSDDKFEYLHYADVKPDFSALFQGAKNCNFHMLSDITELLTAFRTMIIIPEI